jgi:hypothetical protein
LPALKQSDWRNLYSLATEDRSSVVVLRVPLLLSNGQGAQAFAVQREEAQMKGDCATVAEHLIAMSFRGMSRPDAWGALAIGALPS